MQPAEDEEENEDEDENLQKLSSIAARFTSPAVCVSFMYVDF
jgi:hypothetical protein